MKNVLLDGNKKERRGRHKTLEEMIYITLSLSSDLYIYPCVRVFVAIEVCNSGVS